jgi:dephospho-CoA kinase
MIIGIAGFLSSGKGTLGDILIQEHGFKAIAFADAVKDAVAAIFKWPRELLEGDSIASRYFREKTDEYWTSKFGYEVTPRYMMQIMGTEAGRDVFNPNLWVYVVEKIITEDPDSNYVITDVRFPNELRIIKRMGGHTIRVVRGPEPLWFETAAKDNLTKTNSMSLLYPAVHRSEYSLCGYEFDCVIENNGTIEDLKTKLHEFKQGVL